MGWKRADWSVVEVILVQEEEEEEETKRRHRKYKQCLNRSRSRFETFISVLASVSLRIENG